MSESTKYQEVFSHERPRYVAMACLARVRVPCDRRFQHAQADSLPYLKQILKGSVLVIVSLDHQLWPERVAGFSRNSGKKPTQCLGSKSSYLGQMDFGFNTCHSVFFAAS